MVSLECATAVAGDRTLVTVVLESDEPTQVRVENCLDGPVQPPRQRGVPVAGWDSSGFEGVVDGTLALGYATPADPADPPARVVEERTPEDEDGPTPESLVRERGDGTPPRDAVGAAPTGSDGANATGEGSTGDGSEAHSPATDEPVPGAVAAWIDSVETRVADAERLSDATSLDDATAAVAAVGGAEEVRSLRDQLERDREALRAVRRRCETLADRTEGVEVPVEALARLS